MSEWRPIETAPIDRTIVLVFGPEHEGGEPAVAAAFYDPWADSELGRKEGWWALDESGHHLMFPTHWMPLPEPPEDVTDD